MLTGTAHRWQVREARAQRRHRRGINRAYLEALESRQLLSFSPVVSYPAAAAPLAVAAADFNRDGKLDLATAIGYGVNARVSVRLGDGAGGFGAANESAVPGYDQVSSIFSADFNNDSRPDMVVSEFNGFSILIGNGDGTFQPAVYTFVGRMAAVGDFNNDGNIDGVVNWLDGDWATHVQVFQGNGRGQFEAGADAHYWGWSEMAAVDLNNDGWLDVATGEGLAFMNNNGWLEFDWDQQALPSGGAIATGDFTGDGNADLVVAGELVMVLAGRGDGTFAAPITSPANGNAHTAVAAADFNGDGKLDAVVTDHDIGTVSVLLGNGDGTLSFAGSIATGTAPSAVAAGDFNRDGRLDVAVANRDSNAISILLNDGSWVVLPPPPPPPVLSVSDATVTEGNTGTLNATFTVSLSKAAAVDVTVTYNTANISAIAGSDYTFASGMVTIPAGQTVGTFTIAVRGDRLAEPTETFAVNLSAPTNATVGDGQGIGTILDDEPRIGINNVTKTEGSNKTTTFTFTVSLSVAYDQPVTVNYTTVSGTASSGSDYASTSGTLTFAPGETVKTVTVTVKADKTREANETFFVDLAGSSSNALVATARGTGTILDDDSPVRSRMLRLRH